MTKIFTDQEILKHISKFYNELLLCKPDKEELYF